MACVVLGDSIAVGVGQNLPECQVAAKVGISSERYIATLMPPGHLNVDSAVISLGVNDDASLDTLANLRDVRSRITSPSVTWLLPGLKPDVRAMIRVVAEENGDRTLDTKPQAGPDHLHPTGTGYRVLASAIEGNGADEVAEYDAPDPAPRTRLSSHRGHAVLRVHHTSALRHGAATHLLQRGSLGTSQRTMRVAVRMSAHLPSGGSHRGGAAHALSPKATLRPTSATLPRSAGTHRVRG